MEAANKKQYISDTYVLLLQKTPGDKITVKMLIDACGLSRQTFYYHFKDIIDVVEYTLHNILEDIAQKCSSADDPRTAIRLFLVMIEENRKLVKRLENTSRCKDFQRYVAHGIADTMQTVLKKKEPNGYCKAPLAKTWNSWGWSYEFPIEIEGSRHYTVKPLSNEEFLQFPNMRVEFQNQVFDSYAIYEGLGKLRNDETGEIVGASVNESIDIRAMQNYPYGPRQK